MTRESIARAAVRTYPADIRSSTGNELVGTLLDAGEHSLIAFARQLASGTTLHSVGLLSAVPAALALVGLSRALARRDDQPIA